jgi:hypothetical protein
MGSYYRDKKVVGGVFVRFRAPLQRQELNLSERSKYLGKVLE